MLGQYEETVGHVHTEHLHDWVFHEFFVDVTTSGGLDEVDQFLLLASPFLDDRSGHRLVRWHERFWSRYVFVRSGKFCQFSSKPRVLDRRVCRIDRQGLHGGSERTHIGIVAQDQVSENLTWAPIALNVSMVEPIERQILDCGDGPGQIVSVPFKA